MIRIIKIIININYICFFKSFLNRLIWDYIYITNDNPRFESEDKIITDICRGILNEKCEIIKDRKKAIISALNNNNNSIILILGKGVEKYQIIKNKKIDHSDIKIVKNCINENRN